MPSYKLVLLSNFICFSFYFFGQTQNDLFLKLKKEYPNEHVITLKDNKNVQLINNKGKISYFVEYVEEYMIMDLEGAKEMQNQTIQTDKKTRIQNYFGIVVENDIEKYHSAKVSTIDRISTNFIFYDGEQITTYYFKKLLPGTILRQSYVLEQDEVHFPTRHYFYSNYPLLQSEFTIEYDNTITPEFQTYNSNDSILSKSQEQLKSDKTKITYTLKHPIKYRNEAMGLSAQSTIPHVFLLINSYQKNNETIRVLANPDDLHRLYKENVRFVEQETPSKELIEKAEEISKSYITEFEKVKSIYYWVQDNIKYIAFEEGAGGFVPRQPNDVLYKRYGDCKDMASLIYAMLKAIHIESHLTWVGTRDLPYTYAQAHNPYVDNHMITTYENNGKVYVLDATCSFQSIEFPTDFIQGKEVMIHEGGDKYKIHMLPVVESQINLIKDSTFLSIENEKLIGKSNWTINGIEKTNFYYRVESVNAEEKRSNIRNYTERGNESYKVTDYSLINELNRDSATMMNVSFELTKYHLKASDLIYIDLLLDKPDFLALKFDNRLSDISFDNTYLEQHSLNLAIPEGYSLKKTPKNAVISTEFAEFKVDYIPNGTQVICNYSIEIKALRVEKNAMKEFINELEKSFNQKMILIKLK